MKMNTKSIKKFGFYVLLGFLSIVLIGWFSITVFRIEAFAPAIVLFLILSWSFWIWMFFDCLVNDSKEKTNKIAWIIIISFTNGFGALAYFFIRRPERIRELGK